MRFAIISDIHGNLPALNAVLEDADNNNIENFIFAGDYCLSNPYPNECIQRIRCLDKKHIIRGNEEKYLENLVDKDQKTWTDGQMQISYYGYRAISADNLDFILSMPNMLKFTCNDVALHIAHSSEEFIADCEHKDTRTKISHQILFGRIYIIILITMIDFNRFSQSWIKVCTYLVIPIFSGAINRQMGKPF